VIEHEGQNELLDQPENAQIGVSSDLVEQPLLVFRKKVERRNACETLRHERTGEVQCLLAADEIFDPPRHPLGLFEKILEIVIVAHLLAPQFRRGPSSRHSMY